MNWLPVATFCAGAIFGIGLMCFAVCRAYNNAMRTFHKPPEE